MLVNRALQTDIPIRDVSKGALIWAICAFIFCFPNSVFSAQDNIKFETLSLEDGLSQENVRAIHQDKNGFMWFGTQEGLNRYDGYQFKVFLDSEKYGSSLSSSYIYSIVETSDSKLWIGTNEGVGSFDQISETYTRYSYLPGWNGGNVSDAKVLFVDSSNKLWVGTNNGLVLYDNAKDDFVSVLIPDVVENGRVVIDSIVEDEFGNIWFAANEHGLYTIEKSTLNARLIAKELYIGDQNQKLVISQLMIDDQNILWMGTVSKGVFKANISDLASENFNAQSDVAHLSLFNGTRTRVIYKDNKSDIWIGTDTGLYVQYVGAQGFQLLKHEPNNKFSLADNKISSLYLDNGGVFWVGTYRGLSKWNTATAKFDYYRTVLDPAKSLSNVNINAFEEHDSEHVWVGTHDGLNLIDLKTGDIEQRFSDPDNIDTIRENNVMSLMQDSDNQLWIGYRTQGLSIYNAKTQSFEHFKNERGVPSSLGANGITDIIQSKTGDVWVSAFGGGIHKFSQQSRNFTRYTHDPEDEHSIASNRVLSMYEDTSGMLWLGSWDKGLTVFDPSLNTAVRLQNSEEPSSLGSNQVWTVHEDKNHNIWIGTHGSGLNYLSAFNRKTGNYKFERFGRDAGLPSSVVYGILEDQQGMLWLSTNRGITKFDPRTKRVLNYDSSHGLQGNEFNAGAYHKTSKGQFFFGGTNGVTAFYPADISPNEHVLPVVITRFQRLNEVTSLGQNTDRPSKIEISHKDYLVAFEFAGLDFASPDNNQYAYKLEGFDDEWIEARDVRKATYTNLPSGNYRFRVKASNNDGVWNEEGTDVLLTVLPAPWLSWWAYTIYGLIMLASLYLALRAYRNKAQKQHAYRIKLENEVQKRTLELREANEQLLNASVTDQLTGLHNRRYLSNSINEICQTTLRDFEKYKQSPDAVATGGPRLCFLMFDLDGFKPINDTYGHDAGDKVIKMVADILKRVSRRDDIIIRWGGDEFMIIGEVCDLHECAVLAERVCNVVAECGFDIGLQQRMHLSSSIGFSTYPFSFYHPDASNWEQIQVLADKALYKAKEAGRNTWVGLIQGDTMPPAADANTIMMEPERAVANGYTKEVMPETVDQTTASAYLAGQ